MTERNRENTAILEKGGKTEKKRVKKGYVQAADRQTHRHWVEDYLVVAIRHRSRLYDNGGVMIFNMMIVRERWKTYE